MDLALQVAISGVAAGSVYGLAAVGHALVFRLTGLVHFALGDLVSLAVFTTLAVVAGRSPVTQTSVGELRFAVGLAVGVGVCVAAGAATYVLFVQPFAERGSMLGCVAAMVAVAIGLRAGLSAWFDRPGYVFPDPLPFRSVGRAGFVQVGEAVFQVRAFYVIAVALVLALAATLLLTRTRLGKALEAIASDADGALVVGLPVNRLVMLAFGLAGAFAAVAAIAAAPSAIFSPTTGTLIGLKGLVAAVIVGFSSPLRAFVVAIGLGVAEAAIAGLEIGGVTLGPEWRDVLPIGVALLWITLRRSARRPENE